MEGFAYDLFVALVPGALAGYYSGLLVSRVSRFNSLKQEALRIVRSIDFMGDQSSIQFLRSQKTSDMHLIASDLFMLKHKSAGLVVLEVNRELLDVMEVSRRGAASHDLLNDIVSRWQVKLRGMRMSKKYLAPWGPV